MAILAVCAAALIVHIPTVQPATVLARLHAIHHVRRGHMFRRKTRHAWMLRLVIGAVPTR